MDKAVRLNAMLLLLLFLPAQVTAQDRTADPVSPVDEEGRVVDFSRDIAPLLAAHCLECHSGDDAKAGLRVDDPEILLQYIEPGDIEASTLYLDYLISEDPDMLMPPPAHGGPLGAADLALIRVWIEEGAHWPEGAMVHAAEHGEIQHIEVAEPEAAKTAPASNSLIKRLWIFQGYFHPATVHFPIALLTIGGLFVLLGLKWPALGTQVPLVCLILGSASAVVASLMGWSFAVQQGYPSYTAGLDKEINWHRWAGVGVAATSLILTIVAVIGVRRESRVLNGFWKAGLLVLALAVGLVGHQGGELTYGADFYPKAFRQLMGVPEKIGDTIEETIDSAELESIGR